jgi:hypothetical protein
MWHKLCYYLARVVYLLTIPSEGSSPLALARMPKENLDTLLTKQNLEDVTWWATGWRESGRVSTRTRTKHRLTKLAVARLEQRRGKGKRKFGDLCNSSSQSPRSFKKLLDCSRPQNHASLPWPANLWTVHHDGKDVSKRKWLGTHSSHIFHYFLRLVLKLNFLVSKLHFIQFKQR